jgi:catechol 2,3-dioxygenase-like lactoylglutathione lyase family enzyme
VFDKCSEAVARRSTLAVDQMTGSCVIDHFNLPVLDLARSRQFYEQVLAPLGIGCLGQDGDAAGFGIDTWGFGIMATPAPIPKLHVAFVAQRTALVDAFFKAAIAAGAISNGAPGMRPQYDSNYYAAFVIDPDGHNIEAVYRGPHVV